MRLADELALPFLCGRMVDFEHAQSGRRVRIAKRKGIQPGAQHHILPHATGNGLTQGIFGEAAARHQKGRADNAQNGD